MANLLTAAFEHTTQGGKLIHYTLRHMGRVIVFRDEEDAAEFIAGRWPEMVYKTRKAKRGEILYGVASSKLRG